MHYTPGDGVFDAIVVVAAWHNVVLLDAAAKRLAQLLAPGGVLVLDVAAPDADRAWGNRGRLPAAHLDRCAFWWPLRISGV